MYQCRMRVLTQCSVWYNIPLQKPRQHKRRKGREREREREREFRCGWRASERECVLYRSIIELLWGPASRPWRANGGHPGDDLEISWGIGSTKSRSDEVGRRRNENVCYIGGLLKLSGVPRRSSIFHRFRDFHRFHVKRVVSATRRARNRAFGAPPAGGPRRNARFVTPWP